MENSSATCQWKSAFHSGSSQISFWLLTGVLYSSFYTWHLNKASVTISCAETTLGTTWWCICFSWCASGEKANQNHRIFQTSAGREVSNSAVESSWKSSSFPRPVSHEYPASATEGLWRKQAHNNRERFVTTGVKWMKPRGRQVMQLMEKKKKGRKKNPKTPQLLHRSIHHSLWPSRNVLTDTKRFVWHCASELEWLLLTALFPSSRAPSSGGCKDCPRSGGEWCTIPLKAI